MIVNAYDNPSGLKYVANTSIAHYGGKFWAIMDGSTAGYMEGQSDQQIWMATSTDAVTWTAAFQPFRDSNYCTNPMTGSIREWQPNLVVVGSELWALWTGGSGFISKLTDPEGKWTNYRFEFIGEQIFLSSTITGSASPGKALCPTIDGISDWLLYPSGDPIVLRSGVVACPATLESQGSYSTQIVTSSTFVKALKYNVVCTTSNGTDWSMTRISNGNFGDYSAWEPYVVENPVGHIYVFSRNLDPNVAIKDSQLVARSFDGGQTFAPFESSDMLVPQSRGSAKQVTPSRWFMVHCDHAIDASGDRINGALFVSRRGVDDFVPGVNFSDRDTNAKYPQFTVVDGTVYITYTSGSTIANTGGTGRYSNRLVAVSPLPDDDVAYIHPRSLSLFGTGVTDPTLVADSLPYYKFNGYNQILSSGSVTTSGGLTYVTWIGNPNDPPLSSAIIDTRSSGGTLFRLDGLSIGSVNLLHRIDTPPGDIFLASVIDNSAMTVTAYIAYGQGDFITKTSYFKSILFTGQPSNGETVTIDGVVYTFKNSPSLSHDVQIGGSASATVDNLKTAINAILGSGNTAGTFIIGTRLLISRPDGASFAVSSGSSNVTVESSISLSGGQAYIGTKIPGSSVPNFYGKMYDAQIYDSALTVANMRALYNSRRAEFGYGAIGGSSTVPGSPLLRVDPANPDGVTFPSVGDTVVRCEIVNDSLLRIHGEGSASVELPYGVNELTIRYKLGAAPVSSDKYVIASFGSAQYPLRLYIDAANPTSLYANGRFVTAVSNPTQFTDITIVISTDKITIGSFEQYFSGKPRCYLGNALPENLLAATKTIDYDISSMVVSRAERS